MNHEWAPKDKSKVEKREVWSLAVVEERELLVTFNEPLTAEEAIDAFVDGDYYDITNEQTLRTIEVTGAA